MNSEALLASSELGSPLSVSFYESTPENIARNDAVRQLLSMAALEPVVCIGGKVSYLGGFSPEGLLDQNYARNSKGGSMELNDEFIAVSP
jgi:uncharacterized protein (DUF2252 family)